MFCRLWYEIEFEACPNNNMVLYFHAWKQSSGTVAVSSDEFLKLSSPFQKTETGPMTLRGFFETSLWVDLFSPELKR